MHPSSSGSRSRRLPGLRPEDLDAEQRRLYDAILGGRRSRGPELLAAYHEGEAAIEAGDYLDADQLSHAMRDAGRLPRTR